MKNSEFKSRIFTVIGTISIMACVNPTWATPPQDIFSPVKDTQVPSGLEYPVKQPTITDPNLFKGKHVAILASHGVEESEITYPYEFLIRRGATVDILVPEWTKEGIVASKFLKPTLFVKASSTFNEAMAKNYDLLILTGGAWNAQVVRSDSQALDLVSKHFHRGRALAAICAGSSILINAGISKGRTLTGSPVIRTDLENSGAHYIDQAKVINGNLLTSRSPNDLPEFVEGLQQLLSTDEHGVGYSHE
ncbi:MAG: DJ-1/PfpI family protein [Bdellovibrionales bacterium]|jgi:protease I|nr:DJ-1/PfpI family protein [Bdellovibrionales bacterium]